VVLRDDAAVTADELITHMRDRLARYKVPRSVVLATGLPRNATGKLLKAPIRARYGSG
jgi:fatty-acyl-CoA synthase